MPKNRGCSGSRSSQLCAVLPQCEIALAWQQGQEAVRKPERSLVIRNGARWQSAQIVEVSAFPVNELYT
ncbi:hypothetical protein RSI60_004211 [Yersinia enterocolitica]|nr:hypothetical protein [Yersinia enterocolitica]